MRRKLKLDEVCCGVTTMYERFGPEMVLFYFHRGGRMFSIGIARYHRPQGP